MFGRSNTRASDIARILSLSAPGTNPHSRASDKEIENAVRDVQKGSLALSRSNGISLIKRAVASGEKNAVGSDTKKHAFLSAVKRGRDREFLQDVLLKLMYADKPSEFTGKCGRVICSREYIEHIEKHVFDYDVPNYYTGSNGDKAYAKNIRDRLEYIVQTIISDMSRYSSDYGMLPGDRERIKMAVENIRQIGFGGAFSGIDLFNQSGIEDVTERLNKLMKDSEEDVLPEFRMPMIESILITINDPTYGVEQGQSMGIDLEMNRFRYFMDMVRTGAKYDLKNRDDWKGKEFLYNGVIYPNDMPGNTAFGYFGMAMGIPEIVLYFGAGEKQVEGDWENIHSYYDLETKKRYDREEEEITRRRTEYLRS